MKELDFGEILKSWQDAINSEKIKLKKPKMPQCWACRDTGLIMYEKQINGVRYECASRCRCQKGNVPGEKISIIPEDYYKESLKANFDEFEKHFPEVILANMK